MDCFEEGGINNYLKMNFAPQMTSMNQASRGTKYLLECFYRPFGVLEAQPLEQMMKVELLVVLGRQIWEN